MSVPVTPTSARRRPVSQVAGSEGNENSGTGSWLGAFGEMMGELLQSWGIFGALKRRGWGTAGARSTPNTPPPFSRSSSPTHEQIELSHLNIQCRQNVEGGCRVERVGSSDVDVRRRVRGCRSRPNPSRHSFHEGASPDSYLLTALLIHSLKHGSGVTCSEPHCHLCLGRQYAGPRLSAPLPPDAREWKRLLFELQSVSAEGSPLGESSAHAIEDASPEFADPPSLSSLATLLPSSDTFLSTSDLGTSSEQTSSCKESDASFSFPTDAATLTDHLTESRPYCTSSFFGDVSCDSATLTGHNFELPKDSSFEDRSSAALDCDLSVSVCSLPCRLWPREGDALERPVLASGSLVLVPRRPSLSSSNTGPSSHFRWEEVRGG